MHPTWKLLWLLSWTLTAQAPASSPSAPLAPRPPVGGVLLADDPLATDAGTAATDEHHHHHHHPAPATEATDPVCGMKVNPAKAGGGSVVVDGQPVFFCSSSCRQAWLAAHDGGVR